MYRYSTKSKENLSSCDKEVQEIFEEAIKIYDITIIEGHRNEVDQNKQFEEGDSRLKWPDSNHNELPSQAVDAMPYKKGILWHNIYSPIQELQEIANQHNIEIYGVIERLKKEIDKRCENYYLAGLITGISHMKNVIIEWGGRWESFFDGPHYQKEGKE